MPDRIGRAVRLQNEKLNVDVLPDNGGRIASIRCRRTGTEFLLGGSTYGAIAAFSEDAAFEESDCAGWDECLPTISRASSDAGGFNAPDHGDLWRRPWTILEQTENLITLSIECFSRPLTFTRALHLESTRLRMDYRIVNRGDKAEPFLYACHPLFAVDEDDLVLLPSEVDSVRLHFSRGDRVGHPGEQLPWPLLRRAEQKTILNRVSDISTGSAEMFYVTSLRRGICALYRYQRQQAVVMRFSIESLPILGLWICNGGWPEKASARKQYAVALEPTVAPFGSLAEAVASNAASVLQPRAEFNFSIEVGILGCDLPCTPEEVIQIL
jgi:galactose mutarotase-like enzyme